MKVITHICVFQLLLLSVSGGSLCIFELFLPCLPLWQEYQKLVLGNFQHEINLTFARLPSKKSKYIHGRMVPSPHLKHRVALIRVPYSVGSWHREHLQSKYHPSFNFFRLIGVVSKGLTYCLVTSSP